MRKFFFIIFLFLLCLSWDNRVRAAELVIEGNGTGSQNQIIVNSGSVVSVPQNNSAIINNVVNSSANTGGNSITGSSNGSIVTGNASSQVTITNKVNTNQATPCATCTITPVPPTSTSAPKPSPTSTPAANPTTPPQDPGSGPTNSSGSTTSPSGIGGAQVLSLSATSGESDWLLSIIGSICLLAAVGFFRAAHSTTA